MITPDKDMDFRHHSLGTLACSPPLGRDVANLRNAWLHLQLCRKFQACAIRDGQSVCHFSKLVGDVATV